MAAEEDGLEQSGRDTAAMMSCVSFRSLCGKKVGTIPECRLGLVPSLTGLEPSCIGETSRRTEEVDESSFMNAVKADEMRADTPTWLGKNWLTMYGTERERADPLLKWA